MSTENERHPSALSEDERTAMMKAFPAAFDADGAVAAAGDDAVDAVPGAQPADADQGATSEREAAGSQKHEAAEGAGAQDTAAAAGGQAGEDGHPAEPPRDDAPVSRKEFNGVLNELRQTREKLKQANTEPAPPPRDFDAELRQLDEKLDAEQQALLDRYDEGELDAGELAREQTRLLKEYQASVRTVTVDESKHVAATTLQQEKAAAAAQSAQQEWDAAIGAWKESNADFLANPIRRNAVAALLDQFGADAALTNEQVIEEVQKAAFEAFNWKSTPTPTPADPHAARNLADRQAAARASADTPPTLNGGVGGRGAPGGVDLSTLKPGEFSRLPRAEQEKLLGAGAL